MTHNFSSSVNRLGSSNRRGSKGCTCLYSWPSKLSANLAFKTSWQSLPRILHGASLDVIANDHSVVSVLRPTNKDQQSGKEVPGVPLQSHNFIIVVWGCNFVLRMEGEGKYIAHFICVYA